MNMRKYEICGLAPILLWAGLAALCGMDWPQYRGAAGNSESPELLLSTWPANGPRQVWRTGSLTNGFSAFAVSGDRAFTQIWREHQGQNTEFCVALEAATGRELWSIPVGTAYYPQTGAGEDDGPRSTPSIQDGRVFVLTTYLSLLSLDAARGTILWSNNVLTAYGGKLIPWQNAASPTVDGDLVFVSSCATSASLMAFRAADGSVAWRAQNEKATHATPAVTTLHGVRQVIYATQTGYVALERNTGQFLWKYPYPFTTPPSLAVSPVVHQDMVFCSAGYGAGAAVARIEFADGTFSAVELWKNSSLQSAWMTPVCQDGFLYGLFSVANPNGPLKCLELATGRQLWSVNGFGAGGTILVGGNLLVLTEQGRLVMAAPSSQAYRELARYQAVTGKCWNHPVVAQGRLYARSTTDAVCLDLFRPALKLQAPSRGDSNRLHLAIGTVDGSAISPDRSNRIEVWAGTHVGNGVVAWAALTNRMALSDGLLWMYEVDFPATDRRFFIAVERP